MEHAYKFVLRYGSILAVVLIIVWPLLALAAGTFSKPYFYFWVIISIIWGLVRARAVVQSRSVDSCSDLACKLPCTLLKPASPSLHACGGCAAVLALCDAAQVH